MHGDDCMMAGSFKRVPISADQRSLNLRGVGKELLLEQVG